jgi:cytochrome c oxidase subunit 2
MFYTKLKKISAISILVFLDLLISSLCLYVLLAQRFIDILRETAPITTLPSIPSDTLVIFRDYQIYCDAAVPWQLGFQDPATPIMLGIIDLHNDIMGLMVFILLFVMWMLGRSIICFRESKHVESLKFTHGTEIEVAWTVTPSLILVAIAIPSFALLYSTDELNSPSITLKVIGHQWYWTYEYSDYTETDEESIVFDSYMIPEDDLELGQLRLLEVDNRVVLPTKTHVRVILTSADVLHCWAIPSLGVKCDCVPGRLNQISIFLDREGLFYGQCSELCGANHGFMPIVVESVSMDEYSNWIRVKYTDI